MTKLSVIMPCYNCESTLEQAVDSVLQQTPIYPFDLTMIDDGSTDSTFLVMKRLATRHRRIKLLRSERNLGGGTARNRAIAHSDGDLLFCMDADDVLSGDFLRNMTEFWRKRKCDAVGMSTSIKFRRADLQDIAYVDEFERPGERVRFESFLEGSRCSLSVVFLMRRTAFDRVGGYPTEHAFDTQGMAFRFLCNGLDAYTCTQATYYHRVGLPRSYYRREQRAGRLNWNWFNVLDEFQYVFTDRVRKKLLQHDLFEGPGRATGAPVSSLVIGKKAIYSPGLKKLIRLGPSKVAREYRLSRNPYDQYWLGNFHRLAGRYRRALDHYSHALTLGLKERAVFFRMLQTGLALAGDERPTQEMLDELSRYSGPYPADRLPWDQRLFHYFMGYEVARGTALAAKNLRDRLRRSDAP